MYMSLTRTSAPILKSQLETVLLELIKHDKDNDE
jgi:hypothetical protein